MRIPTIFHSAVPLLVGVLVAATVSFAGASAASTGSGQPVEAEDVETSWQSLEARNKRTVVAFYNLAFNAHRPAAAAARYATPDFIQHNPGAADGAAAFVAFVTGLQAQFPQSAVDIRTVLADRNKVVTHSLFTLFPGDRGQVFMDIFRLRNGKIVEHWDVIQPFPETSANPHPMF